MKKKLFVFMLMGLTLVSCNNNCECSCLDENLSLEISLNGSEHYHDFKKEFDDEKHYEKCTCGIIQNEESHSYVDIEEDGYIVPTCSCGHKGTPIEISETIKVYFSAPASEWWGDKAYCYLWEKDVESSEEAAWPGNEMTYVETNDYGQKVFSYEVDLAKYNMIIFSNGNGWQTPDISLIEKEDNSGFYLNDDGTYGTYTYVS